MLSFLFKSASRLAIAGLCLTASAMNAFAQSDDSKPFDGVYVGGEFGYSKFKLDVDIAGVGTIKDDSLYYGGVLGWRQQTDDGLVFGTELRFGDSNTSKTFDLTIDGEPTTVTLKAGRQMGIDAILGTVFGREGGTLAFVSGGYVNGKASAFATAPALGLTVGDSDTDHGFRVGGGIEQRVLSGVHVRLTGHYNKIDNVDFFQLLGGVIIPF